MRILPHCHIGWRNRFIESLNVYKAIGISFVQDPDPILLRSEKQEEEANLAFRTDTG
jgi:hypothetical protein